jgi:hypothetical protein
VYTHSVKSDYIVSFRIPITLLERIDELAGRERRTRANFILKTLTEALAGPMAPREPEEPSPYSGRFLVTKHAIIPAPAEDEDPWACAHCGGMNRHLLGCPELSKGA